MVALEEGDSSAEMWPHRAIWLFFGHGPCGGCGTGEIPLFCFDLDQDVVTFNLCPIQIQGAVQLSNCLFVVPCVQQPYCKSVFKLSLVRREF